MSTSTVSSSSFKFVTGTRRHPRINVAIPVKVSNQENPQQSAVTCTYEVSLKGCKISNYVGLNAVDQLVCLNRKNRKAIYKVVWIESKKNQVGLQMAEQEKMIWDEDLAVRLNQ